ncbi:hypothetical protein NITLEN_10487 [Nitrospira lenta]|uniref:Uncharacterized protein n=1 Tax=Nitrospira lenta TaxID=1436998 RepID=A0A330L0U5_9BACT|nr:hypothetical protein NITLEN_10487 [Nitrospira lenta]
MQLLFKTTPTGATRRTTWPDTELIRPSLDSHEPIILR